MTAMKDGKPQQQNGTHMDSPSAKPFEYESELADIPSCFVHRVAITGGPCAGKTTALAEIAERLRSRGYGVFTVPEAATIMFTGGASLDKATDDHIVNFQTQLFKTQMALEDSFSNLALTSKYKQTFILCDRGTCDGRAYMSPNLWNKMLKKNHWNMVDIRDGRYDLVIHLVTAANGACEYYSLDNNKTRSETPKEACIIDKKLQSAWVGHPHLRIVDNRTDFRQKMNRVDSFISQLAGLHLSRRIVKKFLLKNNTNDLDYNGDSSDSNSSFDEKDDPIWPNLHSLSTNVEHFSVKQTFLSTGLGADVQESVRRRGKNGVFTYVHKVRREESEKKRQITLREYNSLLTHADKSRITVEISRKCFLHDGKYFVLDCVTNVEPKIQLLRCHVDSDDGEINIPSILDIEREVTGERQYSMHAIATNAFAQKD